MKLSAKARRQTAHDSRVWATRVVAAHELIAVEDFKPVFLNKSRMARKAADAAIGAAKRELVQRGSRAGRKVVMVQPAYTTMTCSSCFARTKQRLELTQRIFLCPLLRTYRQSGPERRQTGFGCGRTGHTRVEDVRHLQPSFGSACRCNPSVKSPDFSQGNR